MPVRKEDEIMAEHLLKGGKMLEKSCKTCGCPLFEVKGKTLCVVCAENAKGEKPVAAAASPVASRCITNTVTNAPAAGTMKSHAKVDCLPMRLQ